MPKMQIGYRTGVDEKGRGGEFVKLDRAADPKAQMKAKPGRPPKDGDR